MLSRYALGRTFSAAGVALALAFKSIWVSSAGAPRVLRIPEQGS